jgi:hypothetical protein
VTGEESKSIETVRGRVAGVQVKAAAKFQVRLSRSVKVRQRESTSSMCLGSGLLQIDSFARGFVGQ